MKTALIGLALAALLLGCGEARNNRDHDGGDVAMTDAEKREKLSDEQYRIAFEGGTEPAFTGKYWDTKTPGTYHCAVCGQELFTSETKYDSGCGWPSFYQPIEESAVAEKVDRSHGMVRTEVVCSKCGAHLGHVFPDGPQPTGERYCMNSAVLDLVPGKDPK